ncbi:MAG TPA: chloride channel protein [Terriglobales bacterium]|nr:chloride channel protein [Terriglobales bacterium]
MEDHPTGKTIEDSLQALPPSTRQKFPRFFSRYIFREERLFLVLSIVIGIVSGLAVVGFRYSIDWSRAHLLGSEVTASHLRLILVPTLVGLVIAILVIHIFPRARGSGVNQTKAALYIYNGHIPFRTAIGKFITASLAIGSGQSLGPEDPSLQIGAGIASALGRRLRFSRDRMRLLAPIGAAAGLAAAFNAPISAVLFVIEEVVGRWSVGVLGSIVLSAVSSVVVMRSFLGSEPLFSIPPVELRHAWELLAYAVLGVAGGLASLVFAGGIALLRPKLKAMPRWTQYFQPALAGLIIGVIAALGAPQIMGAGYSFMDQAILGHFTWQFLGILAGLKILSTVLSFTSGTPGGMFAPTLFIGAMLGAFIAGLENLLVPHLAVSTATYALVGMGVLFAGFLRAPMTSVFMVLEVSGNYSIILPVIVANTVAYVISRAFWKTPIFDLLTRQDGLELPSMEEQRELSILRVEDAMHPFSGAVLDASLTIAQAAQQAGGFKADYALVHTTTAGWNLVKVAQLASWVAEGKNELSLHSLLPLRSFPYLHPDHPLEVALRYVDRWPIVPVVNRANFSQLEGVVSKQDVLARYQVLDETD